MSKSTAWIAKWVARWAGQPHPAPRKSSQRVLPILESLEDRRLLSGLHYLTNQHTDLDVTYSTDDGKLHLAENNKSKDPIKYYKNTKHFVLEFLPGAERAQTADPRFAFTGAAPGDPIWIVPISPRDPNLLQLGVSGERIDDGVLGAYNETDPRINNIIPFPWIRLSVLDVQGPGYFSVWQDDDFGNPTVWVATAGNPNPDLFFTGPGGHVDYNWAFTQPGDYYVDIQASAYLADGTPVSSDVATYHFQVDPVPGSGAAGKIAPLGLASPFVAGIINGGSLSSVQSGPDTLPTNRIDTTPAPAREALAAAPIDRVFAGPDRRGTTFGTSSIRNTSESQEPNLISTDLFSLDNLRSI